MSAGLLYWRSVSRMELYCIHVCGIELGGHQADGEDISCAQPGTQDSECCTQFFRYAIKLVAVKNSGGCDV